MLSVRHFYSISFIFEDSRRTKLYVTSQEQVAQLSQRDRAMLCVIQYFAKSFKVTQSHSK